ncbi:hypothetical protein B0H14DRAFT_2567927 [Mycena olivaceomarginata]|nr:hypothetical protein B0H14DRAFT_2567927 [Mycena olivaceomarginata]
MATTTVHEDLPPDDHPRTSTPRRDRSPRGNDTADVDESVLFEGHPIHDYDGPVEDEEINNTVPVVRPTVTVPTTQPLPKIGTKAAILARRSEAIDKGAPSMGKGFLLTAQKAMRKLHSSIFPRELDLLEKLFSEVERLELFDGTLVYRVEKARFQQLQQIFDPARDRFLRWPTLVLVALAGDGGYTEGGWRERVERYNVVESLSLKISSVKTRSKVQLAQNRNEVLQRQERNREKQLNPESITGRETMKLRAQAKDDKLEITKLRKTN